MLIRVCYLVIQTFFHFVLFQVILKNLLFQVSMFNEFHVKYWWYNTRQRKYVGRSAAGRERSLELLASCAL